MRSVFKKGFMYRLSCNHNSIVYIAENKTLVRREDRSYEGKALGRKMAVFCFESCLSLGAWSREHKGTLRACTKGS